MFSVFDMGEPNIKACLMPFFAAFAKLLNPCSYFLQHIWSGLQANLLETNKNFNIIINILACFDKSMAKTQPSSKNYKSQRTIYDN
jgi:hypothetical protein